MGMQKETESAPDRLVFTGLFSGIKVIYVPSLLKYYFSNILLDLNIQHTWLLPVYPKDGGVRSKGAGD